MSGGNPITVCPNCNEPLEPDFEVCPNCGKERSLSCPNCQKPIKSKWKVCPRCRTALSGWATPTHGVSSTNAKSTDESIGRIFVSGAQSNNESPLVDGDELLGRFVIKAKLGAGGFGTVYLAHDHERRDDIALKVVGADSGKSQAATEQLRQELRLRDRINDFAHIIRTYDIHTVDYKGLSFVLLPMEYAKVGSLRSWLIEHKHDKKHRISEGLELFKQTCLGIKAIHDAGLAHLDLKPENLLLCKDGDKIIVKVSDFGISRNVEHFSINVASIMQESLGTPYYMSPEQIRAARQKDVGPQADIYSLGVILFEILDGDPPFDGSAGEVKRKHLEMDPPKLKGIDTAITTLVDKCLTKKPAERFKSMASVLNTLGVDVSLTEELDENTIKIREAIALYSGIKGKIDYAKAKELFLELAEQGDPLGEMWIARCYDMGRCDFPYDTEKAEKIAGGVIDQVKQLALLGNETAAFLLGGAYEDGLVVQENYEKAMEWYRKAAGLGSGRAAFNLGRMYEDEQNIAQDFQKAVHWYTKAAQSGDCHAMVNLGAMYVEGRGVRKDCEKAVEWYSKAAEAGETTAMVNLGAMYVEGDNGVDKDCEKAAEWYHEAAKAGNNIAMSNLGLMYKKGWGVEPDSGNAVKWYLKAAEAGNSDAMSNLGWMYEEGDGVAQDEKKVAYWFRKSAEAGNMEAMTKLACMYQEGSCGIAKDYDEAKYWFHKAAEIGDSSAMLLLGSMYLHGQGVTKNHKKGIEWIHKAAENGNSFAMCKLGLIYKNGEGVAQDYKQAFRLLRNAAEKGECDAMLNLGVLYQDGLGITKDHKRAWEWYYEALKGGNSLATEKIMFMYKNELGIPKDDTVIARWHRVAAEAGSSDAMNKLAMIYEKDKEYAEAMKWYHKAADAGDRRAMNNLGRMYNRGIGVVRDREKAIEWERKAKKREREELENEYRKQQKVLELIKTAAAGNIDAMYELGLIFEQGEGVFNDYTKAMEWYRKAARYGNEDAKRHLTNLGETW